MKRRISILSHTVSNNALGRAWVFAELLADDFEVELVLSGKKSDLVWAPLREQVQAEQRWFVHSWPGFHLRAPSIARELVRGDLIIAIKPLLHSYGLGLAARRVQSRPLLLDIDDWDLGFCSPWRDALEAPVSWLSAKSHLHRRWYFRRTGLADAITVSSTFLQQRFGGTWIPHARRAEAFQPRDEKAPEPLVMFVGTPQPHKGLEDLLLAFRRVTLPQARLCIIGTHDDKRLSRLAEGDSRITLEPPLPAALLPERLAQAWLIAIPQRTSTISAAQLPAKLMDAMALGKAVVSTDVGDIPKWLPEDCGVIVPPGNPAALAAAIQSLLADPARLAELGRNARQRFLSFGSYEAVKPRLLALVQALLDGKPPPRQPAPFL